MRLSWIQIKSRRQIKVDRKIVKDINTVELVLNQYCSVNNNFIAPCFQFYFFFHEKGAFLLNNKGRLCGAHWLDRKYTVLP